MVSHGKEECLPFLVGTDHDPLTEIAARLKSGEAVSGSDVVLLLGRVQRAEGLIADVMDLVDSNVIYALDEDEDEVEDVDGGSEFAEGYAEGAFELQLRIRRTLGGD